MKTIRIAESGAVDRLVEFFNARQAALADRLQQMLDSLSPRDIKKPDGTVWPAPQGMGAGKFTVTPAPTQDPGQELVYVKDDTGMEVLVDPTVALPYLQGIPPEGITPELVWNALNDASAESQTSALTFSGQDEAAESAWDQAITASQRKKALSEVEEAINEQAEFYKSQLDEDTKRKIQMLNEDLYNGPLYVNPEDPDEWSYASAEEGYVAFDFQAASREVMDLLRDMIPDSYADDSGSLFGSENEAMQWAMEGRGDEDSMRPLYYVDSSRFIEKILGKELYNTIR
jgi:hypothetical protein